ncbi:MAG: radical SAM protein [Clostridia bacterium]|nr:radical SAM protein [Clostridia bacterium]
MSIQNKLAQYREWKSGVKHCTFNPEGPGVVRIHLIPPKFRWFGNAPYIVILNGYYLLPLGYSWAVMLSFFMSEVNRFDGCPIGDKDADSIVENTLKHTRRVYPSTSCETLREDLETMLGVLFAVAKGEDPNAEIERLSIRAYARNMTAPHRVDLMVSAMTDAHGTWQCNQKCLFCYAAGQSYAKTRELTTREWKEAIDRLRDAGVPMLTFTGGEPTLRADLAELIGYSKWFVTRLNTNGVALTPTLVEELKQASLDSVQITLYAADETIHNELVGGNHFADTLKGIQNAVRAGLDVSVNTPLCKKNADYLATLKLLNGLGVRFVTVSGLICTGMAGVNHAQYDLCEDELVAILRNAKRFCGEHGMEIDFTSPGLVAKEKLEELSLNVPSCGAALSNMAIAPDGTVVPCQSWLTADAGLGNILTDPFEKIWKHKNCVTLRKMSDAEALSCPFRKGQKEVHHGS